MVIEHETMKNTKKERTEVGALAPKIASGDNVCGGSAYSFSNFWRFNNHQTHSTILQCQFQFCGSVIEPRANKAIWQLMIKTKKNLTICIRGLAIWFEWIFK